MRFPLKRGFTCNPTQEVNCNQNKIVKCLTRYSSSINEDAQSEYLQFFHRFHQFLAFEIFSQFDYTQHLKCSSAKTNSQFQQGDCFSRINQHSPTRPATRFQIQLREMSCTCNVLPFTYIPSTFQLQQPGDAEVRKPQFTSCFSFDRWSSWSHRCHFQKTMILQLKTQSCYP